MKYQLLNNSWSMHAAEEQEVIPANVPGSVFQDLLENGTMDNPFWKDNERIAMNIMKKDFNYHCVFRVDSEIYDCPKVELVFGGIDTIADIYLNGVKIGYTDNMHRTWKYEVKKLLKKCDNELTVMLNSPIEYIRSEYQKCQSDGSDEAMVGFPHIRKAHYMFGWDWGPHLPDAGIWRNVKLQGIDLAWIDNVYIRQIHNGGKVNLKLEIEGIVNGGNEAEYETIIIAPDGEESLHRKLPEEIEITEPKLWWPNGYGEQNLYKITVIQRVNGTETDRFERRIGLRTMTVHVEKDQWGECFAQQVNGIDCFAMGADYIPEDNLIGRVTRETTYNLLKQCKAVNFNTIRVWGGGYYPDDWFYDMCDELGFMVWQDFMFACAVYELSEQFEENIRCEIEENIKRIRNHACLCLWCGNNEMEMFVNDNLWVTRMSQKADYIKMYEYIIPKLVKKYDPQTFYWPASPSSGGSFDKPNSADYGDAHYWDVWHGNVPFTEYRKHFFRYASEFGFQSFPSIKTIETFTDDEKDLNIFSYVMEKHQRNSNANGKIICYLQQAYLYPTNLSVIIYASQLLQAEAVKYGVEHFRRNRGRCMGAIYWQLNDCWPVTSWSSIDYCGRWKALHYYAKRFFAPILFSCEEEGMLTQNMNINAEEFNIEKAVSFNVSNETREEVRARVKWNIRDNRGNSLDESARDISVPALSSIWLGREVLEEVDLFTQYVSYDLYIDGTHISGGTVLFSLPKYFNFEDPKLSYQIDGEEIIISAEAYAKSVEILNKNEDIILSDNYFDMNAGQKRVKIISGIAENIRLRSVYDIR